MPRPAPTVFVYFDTLPRPTGSGARVRIFSNTRAYLDLGFQVRLVGFGTEDEPVPLEGELQALQLRRIPIPAERPTVAGRVAYRLGVPARSAFEYYFEKHAAVLAAARRLTAEHPHALHQFESESVANVIPFLEHPLAIWSEHDLPSTVSSAVHRIARELEGRAPSRAEQRELRFARVAERRMAKGAPLILSISDTDRERLEEWGVSRIATLPMSVGRDPGPVPERAWLPDGVLRLLHIGRTAHLPSYRSLEFLLLKVFPSLSPGELDRIHLTVAGTCEGEDARSRRIRELTAAYPRHVQLLGFVPDLVPLYRSSDLQLVGATDASGIRTRIIESLAHGVPVLSTTIGAAGILGLRAGENILLADDPAGFVAAIRRVLSDGNELAGLSARGREMYEREHGRDVVAECLRAALARHFPALRGGCV